MRDTSSLLADGRFGDLFHCPGSGAGAGLDPRIMVLAGAAKKPALAGKLAPAIATGIVELRKGLANTDVTTIFRGICDALAGHDWTSGPGRTQQFFKTTARSFFSQEMEGNDHGRHD